MIKTLTSHYVGLKNILMAGAVGALLVSQQMASPEIAAVTGVAWLFAQARVKRFHVERQSKKLTDLVFTLSDQWSPQERTTMSVVCQGLVTYMALKQSTDQMLFSMNIVENYIESEKKTHVSPYEAAEQLVKALRPFNFTVDEKFLNAFARKTPVSENSLGM